MIDLHAHSKYSSDGIDEVIEMLEKAESLGLKYISITDHNSCLAYNDLSNPAVRQVYSGKIITGIELNTKVLGIPIEILGYCIDPIKMQNLIDTTYLSIPERNQLELKRLYEKCINLGISLPSNFVQKYDGSIFLHISNIWVIT